MAKPGTVQLSVGSTIGAAERFPFPYLEHRWLALLCRRGNALIELYGWRNAYLVFGGTTLVMLFPIIYLFMKDRPEEVGEVRDSHCYVERHANDVIEIEKMFAFGHFGNVSITSGLEYRRDLRFHDLRIHRGDDALVLASTRHWYRLVYRLLHYVSHSVRCSRQTRNGMACGLFRRQGHHLA